MNHENVDAQPEDEKTTPPTARKVQNPFDKALINRLHNPICSPGMCKMYKKQNNNMFRWEIDQTCTLAPAEIVACSTQFEPSPDPALEKIAEEATELFFSQEVVMPSPLVSSKKPKPSQTSHSTSMHVTSFLKEQTIVMRDVSAQTVLTLPPQLPSELEKMLGAFCTFIQDQSTCNDYENGDVSLRRKLFIEVEEHSDIDHYDSEHTDDEVHTEPRPPSRFETHTPILFSPDLSRDGVVKGMKRTFGTPLQKGKFRSKSGLRNKILDSVDFNEPCFSPIVFQTPKREESTATSSLASASISPVHKASSDEEKNNFTSPESEAMATCLDCVQSSTEPKGQCFCGTTQKLVIKRSASLKESPAKNRKVTVSFSEKRSLSMSSLHRSRSVQKLDFSMDMSVDGSCLDHSQADSESSPPKQEWLIGEHESIQNLVKASSQKSREVEDTQLNHLEETPVKGKCKSTILTHEISKIRASAVSPLSMSLDNSLDISENALSLEDKHIDFDKVDLKFLTDMSRFNSKCVPNNTDSSVSFKRVDSGFNENTFYTNASSYYESAIKPSELTVTSVSKTGNVLKEISNVNWMRIDSGFKDENSQDSMQFYTTLDARKCQNFNFSQPKLEEKENLGYDRFIVQSSNKNEATMSMSDIFTDDMTFTCNFSSTPSKNKHKNQTSSS